MTLIAVSNPFPVSIRHHPIAFRQTTGACSRIEFAVGPFAASFGDLFPPARILHKFGQRGDSIVRVAGEKYRPLSPW